MIQSESTKSNFWILFFLSANLTRNLSLRKMMAVASLLHASSEFCRTVAGLNFKNMQPSSMRSQISTASVEGVNFVFSMDNEKWFWNRTER